ncbi:MAG: hypothetical protein B7X54_01545 [Idiomarina sp. 34-48-12]|nr:MAG: hypothetical protein B7X54_01545 [Idiomarina sp. 34-48-12]
MTAQILTTVQFDDPDTALVKRAGNGDLQAFREIYERHHRRIYGLVLRLAADREAAQDVTQEVFIQLWRNLERFRGESKFSTWLHTVATRVAITELRKQTKRLNQLQLAGEDQVQYEQQLEQLRSAAVKVTEQLRLDPDNSELWQFLQWLHQQELDLLKVMYQQPRTYQQV